MRIVILGVPGAGKRTQTALLAEWLNLCAVTTGDLLKKAIAQQNQLGLEAKALQDAGRAVTEDIMLGLLREHFLNPALDDGFILDGFPRNLLQALTLDELLYEIGLPLDLVILIDIETDTLMERLVGRRTCTVCGMLYNDYQNPPIVDGLCDICGGRLHQRTDDNEETISNRIHVFDHLIAPLITHYGKSDRLVRVDGNGVVESVFKAIIEVIEQNMGRRNATLSVAMSNEAPRAATEQYQEPEQRGDNLVKLQPPDPEETADTPTYAVSESRSDLPSSSVSKTPEPVVTEKITKLKAKMVKKNASADSVKAKTKAKKAAGKKSVVKKVAAKKAAITTKKTTANKTVSTPKQKLTKKSQVSQVHKKAGGKAAKTVLPKQQAVKKKATKKQAKKKPRAEKKPVQKKRVSKKR
jgi:adenylate kinase